jgi:ribosomal protein L11 methyltransferase
VRRELSEGLGVPLERVTWSWQRQEDWAELWKRGLDTRRITHRIVVHPSWLEPSTEPGDIVIQVDPGMAFGTAEHGTTRGCLRLLDKLVAPGDSVLDVGAGSGILSVCAALLGAADVLAVDMDPLAVSAAVENAERNGVAAVVQVEERRVTESWLRALTPRDGVVANLETSLVLPLLSGLVAATHHPGWLVLSGILLPEREDVLEAVRGQAAHLELRHEEVDGEWWTGAFCRGTPV